MIKHFKYFLHESGEFEEIISDIENQVGTLPSKARSKAAYEFYEIELDCTINTDTGDIEILRARKS